MSVGWVDCSSLGPGWQRREVLRRKRTRSRHSDIYYMSPRGEKIRSRVELTKLLGCSRDLRDFDFRTGVFLDPGGEPEVKKQKKRHSLPLVADPLLPKYLPDLEVSEKPPDLDLPNQKPLKLELELPMEEEEEAPLSVVTYQVDLPAPTDQLAPKPHKQHRQNHHLLLLDPENGGEVSIEGASPEETVAYCASCHVQFPGVMLPTQRRCRWLCPDCREQRRNFNREHRYNEGPECGLCQACKITEDCGRCVICLKRQTPGMKRQRKCLKRRCLRRKKKMSSKKDSCSSKKLIIKWKPTVTWDPGNIPVAKNRKKQLGKVKERKKVVHPSQHPTGKLQKSMDSGTILPAANVLIPMSPKMKQERAETGGDRRPSIDFPASARRPQGTQNDGDVVVLDDEEEDEVEQLQQIHSPKIMEILSLGGVQPLVQLDSRLQEFLEELKEIPLPAHWEMLPPEGGPNLRLVQRSEHSTMSAAVIHIHPSLYFHVVVQDLLVPPGHEVYASHPARLTSVNEVVELIGDLEAWRLCSGWPAEWHADERSEACNVLVYSGCCPQCQLHPWPSEID